MTPREEKLVLELHAKYGNRWSRIARKLPGRTDNEIKNYWRTYMRKTARERKATVASPTSSSSSSNSSSSSVSHSPIEDCINPIEEIIERSFYDTGGKNNTFMASNTPEKNKTVTGLEVVQDGAKVYSMDEIWKDIELSEENNIDFTSQAILTPPSPIWDFNPIATDSLWCMNGEEQSKMLMNQQQAMNYDQFTFYNPFY